MYLGDYIVIEEQVGPYRFSCCCVSTGTAFSAEIDPDKRVFFDDFTFPQQHPSACRFLRPLGEEKIGCTIHADSPAQCKYYRCVIMRILTSKGEEIGAVTGTHALHSEDAGLRMIWNDITREIPGDDADSEERIRNKIESAGYLVR